MHKYQRQDLFFFRAYPIIRMIVFDAEADYSMDTQLNYPTLIKNILQAQTQYQLADNSIESHVVFDDEHNRYIHTIRVGLE